MANRLQRTTRSQLVCRQCSQRVRPGRPAACAFEAQGEGRVSRCCSMHAASAWKTGATCALPDRARLFPGGSRSARGARSPHSPALLAGRDVRLGAEGDAPDRYGRQSSLCPGGCRDETLEPGAGAGTRRGSLFPPSVRRQRTAPPCFWPPRPAAHGAKEPWAGRPTVAKNTESSGDILAGIGRFMLVGGKGLVRPASRGNHLSEFWTKLDMDLAVTIPRQALAHLAAAGALPKSLENKRIHVGEFVEARTGRRSKIAPGRGKSSCSVG